MSHRILIVDDDEDARAILTAILTYHGYEVVKVETAEEMFERLDALSPDLVVLDIRLPGMDGVEAVNRLKGSGFPKPVLLFSEYYDLHADRIRGVGHDGFFPKSKGPLPLLEGVRAKLPPAPPRGQVHR